MQKKLYFLNEEEKNRILNLHESRTKKQYLINEQSLTDWETKLWNNKKNRAETLDNKCKAYPMEFIGSPIVKEIHPEINRQDWEPFRKSLEKIKDIKEYCQISNSLIKGGMIDDKPFKSRKNTLGSGLANYIYNKVAYPSSWIKYFEEPLKNVLKSAGMETLDSSQSTIQADDETNKDWTDVKFSCVLKLSSIKDTGIEGSSDKWKKRTFSDGRIEYFSNTGLFFIEYPNGDVHPPNKNEFFTFTCVNGKPVGSRTTIMFDKSETPNSQVGSTDYSVGPGVVQQKLKSQIPDLLKKANISGSEINQDTINQLYKLLNK